MAQVRFVPDDGSAELDIGQTAQTRYGASQALILSQSCQRVGATVDNKRFGFPGIQGGFGLSFGVRAETWIWAIRIICDTKARLATIHDEASLYMFKGKVGGMYDTTGTQRKGAVIVGFGPVGDWERANFSDGSKTFAGENYSQQLRYHFEIRNPLA